MTIDKVQQTLKYLPEGVEIKGNAVAVKNFFEAIATGGDLLEELKMLREEKSEFPIIAKDNYEIGYNKAIDDFAEKLCCAFNENSTRTEYDGIICNMLTLDIASDLVVDVSEQLRKEN